MEVKKTKIALEEMLSNKQTFSENGSEEKEEFHYRMTFPVSKKNYETFHSIHALKIYNKKKISKTRFINDILEFYFRHHPK